MKGKCAQCGEEIDLFRLPEKHTFIELCEKCGYVRKITWYKIDIDDDIGRISNILEDEKASDEQKVLSIQEFF